jgi:hypothetical protein
VQSEFIYKSFIWVTGGSYLPFPRNYLEELIAEYMQLEEYFVITDLPRQKLGRGGREDEMKRVILLSAFSTRNESSLADIILQMALA